MADRLTRNRKILDTTRANDAIIAQHTTHGRSSPAQFRIGKRDTVVVHTPSRALNSITYRLVANAAISSCVRRHHENGTPIDTLGYCRSHSDYPNYSSARAITAEIRTILRATRRSGPPSALPKSGLECLSGCHIQPARAAQSHYIYRSAHR